MLAVPLPRGEVETLLDDQLSVAAVNAPSLCVASGPTDAVEKLEGRLAERGVAYRRLHTSHAFHSEMMEPALAKFREIVSRVGLKAPKIPYVSNVTGTWITATDVTDPSYWTRHLRDTVHFAAGVEEEASHRRTLELARLVGEISRRGEREAAACRTILRGFADYLNSRPEDSDEMMGGFG